MFQILGGGGLCVGLVTTARNSIIYFHIYIMHLYLIKTMIECWESKNPFNGFDSDVRTRGMGSAVAQIKHLIFTISKFFAAEYFYPSKEGYSMVFG